MIKVTKSVTRHPVCQSWSEFRKDYQEATGKMSDVPAQPLDDAMRFAEHHLEHEWVDRHG
jgi:hypothetical protein